MSRKGWPSTEPDVGFWSAGEKLGLTITVLLLYLLFCEASWPWWLL